MRIRFALRQRYAINLISFHVAYLMFEDMLLDDMISLIYEVLVVACGQNFIYSVSTS